MSRLVNDPLPPTSTTPSFHLQMPPARNKRTSARKKKLAQNTNTPEPEPVIQDELRSAGPETADVRIADEETSVLGAVADCLASGLKPNGQPNLSLRTSATAKGVCYAKVTRRWNGVESFVLRAHESQMSLSLAQETVLVEWIKEVARCGIPWTREVLLMKASKIAGKHVSDQWFYSFSSGTRMSLSAGVSHLNPAVLKPSTSLQ